MAALIALLSAATLHHWIIFGVVLLILELVSGSGFYLFICGVAALCVALLMLITSVSWEGQWLVFALLSLVACVLWYRIQKRLDRSNPAAEQINQRMARYLGRHGDVQLINGEAKLKMDDTVWMVRALDQSPLKEGVRVNVVDYQGTVLIVERL
jgi:membrane protein implicated in regulation of membrane protease activity